MTKKIISVILAISIFLLMPGMAEIVSAASNDGNKADTHIIDLSDAYVTREMDSLTYIPVKKDLMGNSTSGIVTRKPLSLVTTMSSGDAQSAQLPDMNAALLKNNPLFSLKNNSNEAIDANTGSLSISYNLANLDGINNMSLALNLKYNSSASNNLEKGYTGYTTSITGYYIVYHDLFITKNKNNGQTVTEYDMENYYTLNCTTETEVHEKIDQLLNFSETTSDENYEYTHKYAVVDYFANSKYDFYSTTAAKTTNPSSKGLGNGWHFDIPYIKKSVVFDTDGNPDNAYKSLVLDTGKSFNLKNDVLYETNRYANGSATYPDPYPGYTYDSTSVVFNNKTATHVLTCKDGTKYYFDNIDRCIGKEDRFGNGIYYDYDSTNHLQKLSDDFGRNITITRTGSSVLIHSSDGRTVNIVFSNGNISSITYNGNETTTFHYSKNNTKFGYGTRNGQETTIAYDLLTQIDHANQYSTYYIYQKDTAGRPDGSIDELYHIIERYDSKNNIKENVVTYSYQGNYMGDYSYYENQILTEDFHTNNPWNAMYPFFDDLAVISHYSTTMREGNKSTVYSFNPNGQCNMEVTKENGVTYKIIETLYDGELALAEKDVTLDAAGDAVSFYTEFGNDNKGNLLSLKKFQNKDNIFYEENFEYQNPYSLKTSATVNGIKTVWTYSTDGKTALSKAIYDGNILKDKVEYTYDGYGNILTEKRYILPGTKNFIIEYSYADNVVRPQGINLDGLYCTAMTTNGVTDSDGNNKPSITTNTSYDIAGRKLSDKDGNGNITTFTYDAMGRIIRTDYPDSTYETVTYDIVNNCSYAQNRAGYKQTCIYNANGDVLQLKETDTNIIYASISYNDLGKVEKERMYKNSTQYYENRYVYDVLDRPVSLKVYDETDSLLATTLYSYDVVTVDGNTCMKTSTKAVGDNYAPSIVTTIYTDPYGRSIRKGKIFDSTEIFTTYEYDSMGNLIKEIDENGNATKYTYDYAGNVLTSENALENIITKTYDSMGNLLSVTDPLGNSTSYTYDVLGRVLTETVPYTATGSQITKTDYDANGNVILQRITNHAEGESVSYAKQSNAYDCMNRLIATKNYDNNQVVLTNTYTYNAYDAMLTITSGNSTITKAYDEKGQLSSITDALNHQETYTYDFLGNCISKTDRNGTNFTTEYDFCGRTINETATKGSKTEQKTYQYSFNGALIREANADVIITRKYDVLGRMIEETEVANNNTTISSYAYTKSDKKKRHTVAFNGEIIQSDFYEYDAMNRLSKVYKSTATWQINDGTHEVAPTPTPNPDPDPEPEPEPEPDPYDFNTYPNLPTYVLKNEGATVYEFKLVPVLGTNLDFEFAYTIDNTEYGVCISDVYTDPNVQFTGNIYRYNDSYAGVFDIYQNYNGTNEWVEGLDLQTLPDNTDGLDISIGGVFYTYNGNTVVNTVAICNPGDNGRMITYVATGYVDLSNYFYNNSMMSLQSIQNLNADVAGPTETLVATYTYDANGNRSSLSYANGTTTTYVYNAANKILTIQNAKGENMISNHTYTYYLNGMLKSENENGIIKNYQYDDLSRLTREAKSDTLNTETIDYTYDNRGNRITKVEGTTTTAYSYDVGNRLVSETKNGSVTVYGYDNNGNTLSTAKDGYIGVTYNYGLFGTQDSFISNGTYVHYTYKPDGLRHSTGDTVHVWDGIQIVADITGGNFKSYTRGLNLICADENNTSVYYHFNGHGDTVALTNAAGAKTKTYSYDAFGKEINKSATDTNPFRYCGEYYDAISDTLYLRSRYYNANIGRFTQQDEWEYLDANDPLSLNLYTYCWSSPLNMTDAMGTMPKWLKKARDFLFNSAGIVAGAAVAVTTTILTGGNFVAGIASGAATMSVVNNISNTIYYNHFADDKAPEQFYNDFDGEGENKTNFRGFNYMTQTERLDWVKTNIGSKYYDVPAMRAYGEYTVHMYGWSLYKKYYKNSPDNNNRREKTARSLSEPDVNRFPDERIEVNVASWAAVVAGI